MRLSLSVILPVRNEAERITECVESIVNQDLPADHFEIIVIDGMSGDGTWEILQAAQKKIANLRLVENPRRSVSAALNIGIREACGGFFARCDAHAAYASDYLSSCLAVAEATSAGNVGGHARALPGSDSLIAYAIVLAHASPFGLGGARFRNEHSEGYVETVWPGCYRKEIFKKVGGYNELLPRSEDIDLNARLITAGYKCYLSKQIKAWYYCRPDLKSLFRQRLYDGIGIVRTIPVNRSAVKLRHMIPLIFISSVIALAALSIYSTARLILGAELSMYGTASIFFAGQSFVAELRRRETSPDEMKHVAKRPAAALLLPAVFATLHCAYGVGSLIAILTLPFSIRKIKKAGHPRISENQEVPVLEKTQP